MKKLSITTLVMLGFLTMPQILQADETITFVNTTSSPVWVKCQARYKGQKGGNTKHDEEVFKLAPAGKINNKAGITDTASFTYSDAHVDKDKSFQFVEITNYKPSPPAGYTKNKKNKAGTTYTASVTYSDPHVEITNYKPSDPAPAKGAKKVAKKYRINYADTSKTPFKTSYIIEPYTSSPVNDKFPTYILAEGYEYSDIKITPTADQKAPTLTIDGGNTEDGIDLFYYDANSNPIYDENNLQSIEKVNNITTLIPAAAKRVLLNNFDTIDIIGRYHSNNDKYESKYGGHRKATTIKIDPNTSYAVTKTVVTFEPKN